LPDRVVWINNRLSELHLTDNLISVIPIDSPIIWVRKVHTPEHIQSIRSITIDTLHNASHSISEIADLTVAYVLGAVKLVMEGKANNAFANIRPPGHHAENSGKVDGFCAYANVVLAATYARELYNISRILIVDWDYHYGNGTETFFCQDTNIFFAEFDSYNSGVSSCNSTKRHAITYNVGQGYNEDYLRVFQDSISTAMKEFKPELILISCGFDLKDNDVLGSFHVTAAGISAMTKILMGIANEHCAGKIVSILEGGYNDRGSYPYTWYGLAQCAENHVKTLLTGEYQPETPFYKVDSSIGILFNTNIPNIKENFAGLQYYDLLGRIKKQQNLIKISGIIIVKSNSDLNSTLSNIK
jgi:acetoin utilization deacetylase AcuC-like enzyme